MKTNYTRCASCGEEREKLYQHNVCRSCLDASFEKLRPMIDAYRSMRQQAPANRDVAVPVHGT